jgi:monomeric isocitrate dehydrogenase
MSTTTLQGHLRWDSLGEYLALAVSLEHLGETQKNQRALTLGSTLNKAIERLLENRKSPGRKVGWLCVKLAACWVLCCTVYAHEGSVQGHPSTHVYTTFAVVRMHGLL